MYFCRRCRKYHHKGAIARSHRIYAAKKKKKVKTLIIGNKMLYKPQKRPSKPKTRKSKPKLLITKKPLRKAKIGYSKARRGQLKYRITDPYERKEIERLRKQSGMTHIQAVNLWKKAHEHDVDVESLDFGLSKMKTETYEFANEELDKLIDPMSHRSMRDLSVEMMSYGF